MGKKKSKPQKTENQLRQPWIAKKKGIIMMAIVSIAFAGLVIYQMAMVGEFWQGVLWGGLFGGSIWLVYFGMNWFHGLFNKNRKNK